MGLGNGDYRLDEERGTYVPEDGGDYRREVINVEEISPATRLGGSFGISLNSRGALIQFSYSGMDKFEKIDLMGFEGTNPLRRERSLFVQGSLPIFRRMVEVTYRSFFSLNGELSNPPWQSRESEFQGNLLLEDDSVKRKIGIFFRTRSDGEGDWLTWGIRDEGGFYEEERPVGKLKLTGRLSLKRTWYLDLSSRDRWIPFKVVEVEGRNLVKLRGYRLKFTLSAFYGISTGPISQRSPIYPLGFGVRYSATATRSISKRTSLSLKLLGDWKKGYTPRENLSLTVETNF